ncbi:MAG: hypothetical protein ACQEWM_08925 [Actinomycetota bacterium]
MTHPARDQAFRRLLRWYPADWRAQHGEVLLGMLADEADARGASRPSAGQAWSLRVHGVGQRLDARLATWLAAAALVTAIVGGALLLLPLDPGPWVAIGARLGSIAAPAVACLALAALLRAEGVLTGPAAVWASLAGLAAWALAGGAAAAWSLGFDAAAAGRAPDGFGTMAVPLGVAALVTGTAALAPVWASVLGPGSSGRARWPSATVLALLCTAAAGPMSLLPSGAAIAAIAVLLVSARVLARTRPVAAPAHRAARSTRVPARAMMPGLGWIIGLALLAAAGLACVAFALGGAELFSPGMPGTGLGDDAFDSTDAMNAGLAGGSFVAVPTVLGAGLVVTRRFGGRLRTRSTIVAASLVVVGIAIGGVSQVLGAGSAMQWPTLLAATVPVGAAVAVAAWPQLPATAGGRLALAAGIGAAAALVVGLPGVTTAPFWAPLLAIAAAVVAARRRGGRARAAAVASPA